MPLIRASVLFACAVLVVAAAYSTTQRAVAGGTSTSGNGPIHVSKSADRVTVKEPGGAVLFSVTITNSSSTSIIVDEVVDSAFGDLDDSDAKDKDAGRCFDVPITMSPGDDASCTFRRQVTGPGGSTHVNVVTVAGRDQAGVRHEASDEARITIEPRLIDLVIVKSATSPAKLNDVVEYTILVTNNGPDPATNVQIADPAPVGIRHLWVSSSQGTCSLSVAFVTCSLGTIDAGETVTIRVSARVTQRGTHRNTTTVTGSGGRETNPADNVDDATTVVPHCLELAISPRTISADGERHRITVTVTVLTTPVRRTRIRVRGSGVHEVATTNAEGVARLTVVPTEAGFLTVETFRTRRPLCAIERIRVTRPE